MLLVSIAASSFAFDASVCETDPMFGQYDCTVCHTEDPVDVAMSDGKYEAEISNIEFEWENLSDQFNELIYDDEQEYPEVYSNVSVIQDPSRDDSFWTYGEQVLWTEYEGVNEYYTDPGMKLVFRKSKPTSKIMIEERSWSQENASVLVKAPLVFREMDIESFEESDKEVRNYCVLYPLKASDPQVSQDNSNEGNVQETPEPTVDLTSASETSNADVSGDPEVEVSMAIDEEPSVDLEAAGPYISSPQTQTPTGTAHIILLIMALTIGAFIIVKKVRA